ncbi:MAG: GIY-YIG nuclease family protein [Chloroflexi bacterium]|nr:GIY-YIG nuclease family protein [Chloroflexota bacterium]
MDRRMPVHDSLENIPTESGSYILGTRLNNSISTRVGALGIRDFEPGFYFYCGSARGPGGLRARISHHLMPSLRPSWHFDFLKAKLVIESVWFVFTDETLECSFVRSLCKIPHAEQPVRFFGSRDCRSGCFSHLVRFPLEEKVDCIFGLIKAEHSAIRAVPVT